jgi:superoxide dismutase, Cu-Zn family
VATELVLDFNGFATENRRRSDESEAAVTDVETAARDVFALPGDAVFPESVGVDPRDGAAYVGSLADGTLYRAQPPETVEIVSAGGTDGRGSVAGVKFDSKGRLWAAGGYDGSLFVYATEPWELLAKLDVGRRPSCVNDLAFGRDGGAYVTDSFVPTLFRVDPDSLTLESFCDLEALGVPWPEGLNFNGIVLTADQRHLVACQTNTGRYWRITITDGTVDEVALEGGPLPHSDGLAIDGTTLYAAVNAHDTIAVIDLSADGGTGAVRGFVRSPDFRFPTAVAVAGDGLWVVNGQLDRMGATPDLPFTIATIPTPTVT